MGGVCRMLLLDQKQRSARTHWGMRLYWPERSQYFESLVICLQYIYSLRTRPATGQAGICSWIIIWHLCFCIRDRAFYTVVASVTDQMSRACIRALNSVAKHVVDWSHNREFSIPRFVLNTKRKWKTVKGQMVFWVHVYNHFKGNGPFRPLKLFKKAIHSC